MQRSQQCLYSSALPELLFPRSGVDSLRVCQIIREDIECVWCGVLLLCACSGTAGDDVSSEVQPLRHAANVLKVLRVHLVRCMTCVRILGCGYCLAIVVLRRFCSVSMHILAPVVHRSLQANVLLEHSCLWCELSVVFLLQCTE